MATVISPRVDKAGRGSVERRWTTVTVAEAFLRAQTLNAARHAAALRPFRAGEFGTAAASPSDAHILAANRLLVGLRQPLMELAGQLRGAADAAALEPTTEALQASLHKKDRASQLVKHVERTWDFYFELFGQRQSRYGEWLLAADRIALDCYQAIYTGLAAPRSVPAPPPLSFMATGFTPSTYRRGVALTRLGQRGNPFPIIQLPYHRLVNPWTLGAVHHEVSHNIQSDLGLWEEVPRRIERRLLEEGLAAPIARVWAKWNKEVWADLAALLLGGPALVSSLIDVVAMTPGNAQNFNPEGVHPTPYLRVPINLELLRRMGFAGEAAAFDRLWKHLYPSGRSGTIPREMLDTFPRTTALVVDTICYQPFPQLGGKTLAAVTSFNRTHDAMTREAGGRLAQAVDPGIVPARFLVGAARSAIDADRAPPGRVAVNFYRALVRR
ncbi:MAG: hypothetical protein M3457_10885 [Chloroflexota bacterium]|nr:hypothetical protein [Chloroflexota bacterium]